MSTALVVSIVVIILARFTYLLLYPRLNFPDYHDLPFKEQAEEEYDYIIVGGGSAGSILANRLSANTSMTVLLLEAGGDGRDEILKHPSSSWLLWNETKYTYSIRSEAQAQACLNDEAKMLNGRGIGGGSAVNCMVYVRGARQDFDNWAKLGADGWSYKDVLPYFMKAENVIDLKLRWRGDRGTAGPLCIGRIKTNKLLWTLQEAATESGYKLNEDYNGYDLEGFSRIQFTMYGNQRASTARTYLYPAMDRPNLHVVANALVTKIIFEGDTAVGVHYIKNGVELTVRAKKEIVSSVGTIGSAKLLLLSGVGPRKHLESLKIPVVADLPVGENFHDHSKTYGPVVHTAEHLGVSTSIWQEIKDILNLNVAKTPPCGKTLVAPLFVPHVDEKMSSPNLLLYVLQGCTNQEQLNVEHGSLKQFPEYFDGSKHGFSYAVVLAYPKTRGTVTLKSKNVHDAAVVSYQHLSTEYERHILLEGIKIVLKLVNTEAMKKVGARMKDSVIRYPLCAKFSLETDDYWKCYIRHQSASMFHYAGTCRMGSVDDERTVVDPRLRVKGVKNLRVVDASIMPEVTAGNTNAPTVMIAEKGADMIIQDRH